MKKLYKPLLIILSVFVFASCGKNDAEQAGDLSVEAVTALADTYDKIADGSLEGDAAIAEMKKAGAKMKEFMDLVAKKEKEGAEVSEADIKKMEEKMKPVNERVTKSREKAAQSGKLVPEMEAAYAEAFAGIAK